MNLLFKNYINLNKEESLTILKLRNSDYVRNGMYNNNIISESEHLSWIKSLKGDEHKKYWAVFCNNKILGSICLTDINYENKSAQWGIYIDMLSPAGFGAVLELHCIEYFFNNIGIQTLWARVIEDNKKLISMHKNYFAHIDDSNIDTIYRGCKFKGLILSKENWEQKKLKANNIISKIYPEINILWSN